MPELPEVENVARALRTGLTGRRVTGLQAPFAGVLGQSLRRTRAALIGTCLTSVHRHGKYLILTFTAENRNAAHLMIHLRMTGQIFVQAGYVPDKHVHVVFDFEGLTVHYRDIRKFGRLTLVDDAVRPAALDHIGPDMLAVRWPQWRERIAGRTCPIKVALLDQGLAAGLGNIYVDEALFRAGVHPLARPAELGEETLREVLTRARQVLKQAIDQGGTTFLNFTNFHGKPGNFRRKLQVYGRAGEPCTLCGATIERIKVAGRSSSYCPECQIVP